MRHLLRLGRVVSLVLLAVLGTSALMYIAPGYFSDSGEMDAAYSASARADLARLHKEQGSLPSLLRSEMGGWLHGDLGRSRQYGVAVSALVQERTWRSLRLLVGGVAAGWTAALLFALPLSLSRKPGFDLAVTTFTAVLLGLPVGVLAVVCLLANAGGPVFVLALVIAAKDFKVLYRVLRSTWQAPYVLHAHAQGLRATQIVTTHILPSLRGELLSLGVMSFTLALSALVPVEVVFDLPGLGQLAWTAALNRDLPVLVAVTALMSACVGLAGLAVEPARKAEMARCA